MEGLKFYEIKSTSKACHPRTYLVVDSLIEVLDENITLTRLAKGRVTLRPHDTATKI